MWWLWAAFTLLFILAHLAVTQVTKLPFREAFRIARAGAAVVLTGVGFYTLYQWLPFASTTYVLPTPDPFATTLVAIPLAHFAADFVLMPMGWFLERERPRPDLLIHHGAAVTTALLTLRFTIAAPLYLLLLTTELRPITTGLSAIGVWLGRPAIDRLGSWARLIVLLVWRVPFWTWIGWGGISGLMTADSFETRAVYFICAFFTAVTMTLDIYWIYKSYKALRRKS